MRFNFCIFALVLFCYLPALAQDAPLYAQVKLADEAAIEAFYTQRKGEPRWVNNGRLRDDGKVLLSYLGDSLGHGLNPVQYHVPEIEALLAQADTWGGLSADLAMTLEIMLSDGYARYVRDLSGMRVPAQKLGLNPKDWRMAISIPQALEKLSGNRLDFAEFMQGRAPQTKTYQALRAELIRLIEDKQGADEPPVLHFKGLIKPAMGAGDIPKLRARFGLPEVPENARYTYDDVLAGAVMKFQAERGLKADGIIGERTLHALNLTRKDKIKQIIVNLERLRWVPDSKPERFIVVNLPSAMLWAIEDSAIIHEMPVIVGRAQRPTMSFITQISGVRFNPTWTVPLKIKEEDILPELRKDPAYLLDKGIELYKGQGGDMVTVDPMTVNWKNMTQGELKKFRMVQIPGSHNSLGLVRVLMPNPYDIYLHDTNHHSLFNKYDRALSSGCIRMKEPEKIADFILKQNMGWRVEKIKEYLEKKETKDVYIKNKLPVYLLYYTAWMNLEGQVNFGMDIYGHDTLLLQELQKLDGFRI